jgi:hypothetical protein
MQFKIGKVQLSFSSDGIQVSAPFEGHEIAVKFSYLPEATEVLDIQLKITRIESEVKHAQETPQ